MRNYVIVWVDFKYLEHEARDENPVFMVSLRGI